MNISDLVLPTCLNIVFGGNGGTQKLKLNLHGVAVPNTTATRVKSLVHLAKPRALQAGGPCKVLASACLQARAQKSFFRKYVLAAERPVRFAES